MLLVCAMVHACVFSRVLGCVCICVDLWCWCAVEAVLLLTCAVMLLECTLPAHPPSIAPLDGHPLLCPALPSMHLTVPFCAGDPPPSGCHRRCVTRGSTSHGRGQQPGQPSHPAEAWAAGVPPAAVPHARWRCFTRCCSTGTWLCITYCCTCMRCGAVFVGASGLCEPVQGCMQCAWMNALSCSSLPAAARRCCSSTQFSHVHLNAKT